MGNRSLDPRLPTGSTFTLYLPLNYMGADSNHERSERGSRPTPAEPPVTTATFRGDVVDLVMPDAYPVGRAADQAGVLD